MAYFHCKNGNGGVAGVGTIAVEDVQENVITCTKGGTTLTKTVGVSQEVVFDVPESGAWVVSNGTKSKTITIEPQDYEVSFLFNPVLYDLGTFNAEYENPNYNFSTGSTAYNAAPTGGISVGNDSLYLNSGNSSSIFRCLNFKNEIDLTDYSKIRFYTNSTKTTYQDLNISSLSGNHIIILHAGKMSTGTTEITCYVVPPSYVTQYTGYYDARLQFSTSTKAISTSIYGIELIE